MDVDELAKLEALAQELSDSSNESSDADDDSELFSNYTAEIIPSTEISSLANPPKTELDKNEIAEDQYELQRTDIITSLEPPPIKSALESVKNIVDRTIDTNDTSLFSNYNADDFTSSELSRSDYNSFDTSTENVENTYVKKETITGRGSMPTFDNIVDSDIKGKSPHNDTLNDSMYDMCTRIEVAYPVPIMETIQDEEETETIPSEHKEIGEENDTLDDNSQDDEYLIEDDSDSSSSDEDDYSKDFEYASELADNYLDHLTHLLSCLQAQLRRNLERQAEVEGEVHDIDMIKTNRVLAPSSQHISVTKKSLTIFGYPYFKDQSMFHQPPNADVKTKALNKELDPWIENPRPFTKDDRKKLKAFVRENTIARRLARVEEEQAFIIQRIRELGPTDEEREPLAERQEELGRKVREVRRMPDSELLVDRYEELDWDKISVTDFQSAHSPKECELQWRNLVHPDINRAIWCPEEDQLLKRLAAATGGQDWDAIARELNTGRTPHQCFVRYMTRHNVAVNNRKWEKSEDNRLRRLVAHCRINDFIPWAKVSYYMDRRTKDQCFQRYVYSLKDSIRKGTYTEAEDMILIIGKNLYGKDWAKISEMLPCRTPVQLHCRWNSFFSCDWRPWTQDEDHRLLELVRKHGLRDWVSVARDLKEHHDYERNRSQARQRFQFIYKAFKRNPAMALENIVYSEEPGIGKKRQDLIFERLDSCHEEWRQKDAEEGQRDKKSEQMSRFGGSGHIELPNGTIVNNKDLNKFIRYIQAFLPAAEPPKPLVPLERCSLRTLPEHEDEIFKRPVVSRRKQTVKGGRPKKGGYRARGRKVANRDRLGHHATSHTDREIAKFFRPTWVVKQTHLRSSYSEKEVELFNGAGQALGRVLDLSRVHWDKMMDTNLQLILSKKEFQLFQGFRDHCLLYGESFPQCDLPSTRPGSSISVPRVQRTYSRSSAVKTSTSRSQTPEAGRDRLNLLPPCRSTVLAFRGVLLRNQYLRNSVVSNSIKAERDYVDSVVGRGVTDPTISHSSHVTDPTVASSPSHVTDASQVSHSNHVTDLALASHSSHMTGPTLASHSSHMTDPTLAFHSDRVPEPSLAPNSSCKTSPTLATPSSHVKDPTPSSVLLGGEQPKQTAGHLEADRRLVSRFVQMFFWPAKMSATAPPKQDNLFEDSSEEEVMPDIEEMLATAAESVGNGETSDSSSRPVQQFDRPERKRKRGLGLQPPPRKRR